jgi:hypothetical protein
MSGSRGAFTVGINAVDNASKVIDGVSRSFQRMTAPVEKFHKSVSRLGDVTGVSRLTEGMRSLGAGAADAFRSVDRLASPMGALTGAASIAGMVELTRRWGQFGQQLGNIAAMSNAPVGQLSKLNNAFRIAGTTAQVADETVQGFQKTLQDVAYKRPGSEQATSLLATLGLTAGTPGHVKKSIDFLKEFAEAIKGLDAQTQLRTIATMGGPPDAWIALHDGAKGLQEFLDEAQKTGATMTPQMVENATRMAKAWTKFGESIEGVGNRLEDAASDPVTRWLGVASDMAQSAQKWMDKNNGVALSIDKIGASVALFMAAPPVLKLLKLLGYGAIVNPLTAGLAAIVATPGDTADQNSLMREEYPDWDKMSDEQRDMLRQHYNAQPTFGGRFWNWLTGASGGRAKQGGTLNPDIEAEVRKQALAHGLDPEHMVRLARKEGGGFDNVSSAGAFGPMQLMPGTAAKYGVNIHSSWQDNVRAGMDYYSDLLNKNFRGNYAAADAGYNAGPQGRGVQLFAATGDPSGMPSETQDYVAGINQRSFNAIGPDMSHAMTNRPVGAAFGAWWHGKESYDSVPPPPGLTDVGHVDPSSVKLDVHFHQAPPGMRADVQSSGRVNVPPPRIDTALPGVS